MLVYLARALEGSDYRLSQIRRLKHFHVTSMAKDIHDQLLGMTERHPQHQGSVRHGGLPLRQVPFLVCHPSGRFRFEPQNRHSRLSPGVDSVAVR